MFFCRFVSGGFVVLWKCGRLYSAVVSFFRGEGDSGFDFRFEGLGFARSDLVLRGSFFGLVVRKSRFRLGNLVWF